MGICAGGLTIFLFLQESSALWLVLGGLVVCGIGFAFFAAPNTHAVMAAVDEKDYGMASSILSTMRSFGHTGCMLLITLLTGLYLSNQTLTEANPLLLLKMMRMVFVIFLLFCILGFLWQRNEKCLLIFSKRLLFAKRRGEFAQYEDLKAYEYVFTDPYYCRRWSGSTQSIY